MIVVCYPGANQNVREALQALNAAEILDSFFTTFAVGNDSSLLECLPESLRKYLSRRVFALPSSRIRNVPERQLVRALFTSMNKHFIGASTDSPFSPYQIGRHLDARVAEYLRRHHRNKNLTGVYSFETSAYASFQAASEIGLPRIYELSTPYWKTKQSIIAMEAERRPDWAVTMRGASDSDVVNELKTRELQAASTIVCPSKFVVNSLPEDLVKGKRILVAPFGSPEIPAPALREPGNKTRLLFVGNMSQQKGLADVFDAYKLLDRRDVELVVLGAPATSLDFYRNQLADFTYVPPCSHREALALMASCDVFVFPSLFEGRGMVQLEAMKSGLPLISTLNATADDFIEDGVNGFIVPTSSPAVIAEKLTWLLDHPQERVQMGLRARETACKWTWKSYGDVVLDAVRA